MSEQKTINTLSPEMRQRAMQKIGGVSIRDCVGKDILFLDTTEMKSTVGGDHTYLACNARFRGEPDVTVVNVSAIRCVAILRECKAVNAFPFAVTVIKVGDMIDFAAVGEGASNVPETPLAPQEESLPF